GAVGETPRRASRTVAARRSRGARRAGASPHRSPVVRCRRPMHDESPAAFPRVLYRDAAIADGRGDRFRLGVSVLVGGRTIAWIRPTDGEDDPGPTDGLEVVEASGATIVPGMV